MHEMLVAAVLRSGSREVCALTFTPTPIRTLYPPAGRVLASTRIPQTFLPQICHSHSNRVNATLSSTCSTHIQRPPVSRRRTVLSSLKQLPARIRIKRAGTVEAWPGLMIICRPPPYPNVIGPFHHGVVHAELSHRLDDCKRRRKLGAGQCLSLQSL
jgi:hypothetical protein